MSADNEGGGAEWKLVHRYDVRRYGCGLEAGQRVRLRVDIPVTECDGKTIIGVHKAGEIWTVLPGSTQDPGVVFFRQGDGHWHTWDDDPEIFKTFAPVEEPIQGRGS